MIQINNFIEIEVIDIMLLEDLIRETPLAWNKLTYQLYELKPEYILKNISHIRSIDTGIKVNGVVYTAIKILTDHNDIKKYSIGPSMNSVLTEMSDSVMDIMAHYTEYGELIDLSQFSNTDFTLIVKSGDEKYTWETNCMGKYSLHEDLPTFLLPIGNFTGTLHHRLSTENWVEKNLLIHRARNLEELTK